MNEMKRKCQEKSTCGVHVFTFMISLIKVKRKAKISNRYNQVQHLTRDTIWESDKIHENITHKGANGLALSQ